MAEGSSAKLVRKRNEAEIARLQSMIVNQELEVMEYEDKIERLKENIKASKEQIKIQERNISALDKPEGGEEVDG
jgi:predicted  nucleic acid-binding Zn-ribbon protein